MIFRPARPVDGSSHDRAGNGYGWRRRTSSAQGEGASGGAKFAACEPERLQQGETRQTPTEHAVQTFTFRSRIFTKKGCITYRSLRRSSHDSRDGLPVVRYPRALPERPVGGPSL